MKFGRRITPHPARSGIESVLPRGRRTNGADNDEDLHRLLALARQRGRLAYFERDLLTHDGYWDDRLFELHGMAVTPGAAPFDEGFRRLHPTDRDRVVAAWRHSIEQRCPGDAFLRLVHPDGRITALHAVWDVEQDTLGRAVRVYGLALDASAAAALHEQMDELAEHLNLASALNRMGTWRHELAIDRVYWDAGVWAMLGHDSHPDSLSIDDARRHVHPDDLPRLDEQQAALRHSSKPSSLEYRLRRADGSYLPVVSRRVVQCDSEGMPVRVVGVMVDLSREHEATRQRQVLLEILELVTSATGVGLFRQDLTGEAEDFWNAEAYHLWGFEDRTTPPHHLEVQTHVHPDDVHKLLEARQRALDETGVVEMDYRVLRPGGGVRYLMTRRRVLRDPSGRATWMVGVGIDVTHEREASQQQAALLRRLQLATEAAQLGIWEWNLPEDRFHFDTRMLHIYGLDHDVEDMPVDRWLAQYVHPEDRERLRNEVQAARDNRSGAQTTFRVIRADGAVRHIHANYAPHIDDGGEVRKLVGTNLDITELQEARDLARSALERLALAAAVTGMGIWEYDLRAGSAEWNDGMYRLLGHAAAKRPSPRELWKQAVDPLPGHPVWQRVLEGIARHGVYQGEIEVHWPDASVHWIAARGAPQYGPEGEAERIFGVVWDITSQKTAERERQEREAAERANRAKSEFLSSMSHELRTPLNAILGFAQILRSDPHAPLQPKQQQQLQQIESAGWHLLDLINEVLELSRIEAGSLRMDTMAVAIGPLFDEVQTLVSAQARARNLRIELERGDASLAVLADATRLKQVLLNLMSNAVKYNRPSGRIVLRARAEAGHETAHGWVRLEVVDSGIGMSDEQLGRLFRPFDRLGREGSGIEGTGIGLVISRKLVDLMGGRLEVVSSVGLGSTFSLLLPLTVAPGHAERARAHASLPDLPLRGVVLYIEDNAVNTALVRDYLGLAPGVQLHTASTGSKGVEAVQKLHPDLVLIDLGLPDMSGHEVLRRIRGQPELATLCCIAVTAAALPEDHEQALRSGFDGYWTKPISLPEFLAGIREHLGN